ncbi:carboxypeptidase-like regulatory domain-containing protein [Formosa sediminum]|uniref:carboxypeptidase-like regulatory domain-containing protein n=1 Tax=Formosa sediminum TaxID=2594004 RepID=UPI001FE8231F|nr:carboxypeptidase-like regulatory domain-containing protein [Formosa sediminum]
MKLLFILCCFLVCTSYVNAQNLETISGIVKGTDDLENIHVINKTCKTFTITSKTGSFEIPAKLNDTLLFSSIQYSALEVVVNTTAIYTKRITVDLEEHVNALDEVIVGKILTGNLMLDVESSEAEPEINFYDVGIPGYKGKRKTKAERDLSGAGGEFKPIMLLGLLGGSLPVDPIINGITGRTTYCT